MFGGTFRQFLNAIWALCGPKNLVTLLFFIDNLGGNRPKSRIQNTEIQNTEIHKSETQKTEIQSTEWQNTESKNTEDNFPNSKYRKAEIPQAKTLKMSEILCVAFFHNCTCLL